MVFLVFLSTINPVAPSYKYRLNPGAFMEYTVTDARKGETEGFLIWEELNNGTYLPINITSGSKIRAEVTKANETHVLGNITLPGGLITAEKSLDYIYPNNLPIGVPLVQQVTDKSVYQQMKMGDNQKLQGNILSTAWEWEWNNGLLKQEQKLNIISGWIEFFAYIFLVNESIDEIFSMIRLSGRVPGYEYSTVILPILIIGIIIRMRSKKKTNEI
jgi:hypothetical protein